MPHDECPMAIAIEEGRTVRGAEAIAERPDGNRIWFEPFPTPLRDGDGIMLDDGGIVLVAGQAESLAEVAVRTPLALVQLAWHLGNRHTDVQIVGDRLRIRRDHVLEEMAAGLGATVTAIDAPFDPEAGAPHHEHDHGG